jgi:hypothetical protein
MNHKEYFHSGKVAIRTNSEQEHIALNNLMAVDGVKVRELYNENYPYNMVEDPNNEGLKIVSYGAVSPRAKASFDSVLHFLASSVPTFTQDFPGLNSGITKVTAREGELFLEFPKEYKTLRIRYETLEKFIEMQKEFDNFHDVE